MLSKLQKINCKKSKVSSTKLQQKENFFSKKSHIAVVPTFCKENTNFRQIICDVYSYVQKF